MNRIRLFVVLLLSICLSANAFAQEVIYSTNEKFDFRNGDFSVVGMVGDRLYTYRTGSDGYFLDAYNDSMEKLATVVLDFFPSKIYETRFVTYTDKIIVLYQAVGGGKVVQYAAVLDPMGRLLKKPTEIASAKTGFLGPNKDYFSSVVSDDKKTILVYSAADKGDDLEVDGVWIDDQANVRKRSHATFHAENSIRHGEALLDNEGTLYLSASTPVGSKEFADQLWVLTLPSGGTQFASAEFPLNGKYAANAYMKLDIVNNRIYVAGFWSDKKNGNYEGVMFANYDPAGAAYQNPRMLPFDDQLREATGDRNKKRAFNDYLVRQLIIKNDGGFVMIAENYFMTTRTSSFGPGLGYYSMMYSYGPYMNSSVREYHYNDILALSYNASGTRDWHAFVRKDQFSTEDGGVFSSYAFLNSGGALGFLYNDYNSNRSKIQLASIDGAGKVDLRSMAAGRSDDPDWLPRSGKQVSAREIVIPCLRKRQICFAKVVF
jgi:hypothetical protein